MRTSTWNRRIAVGLTSTVVALLAATVAAGPAGATIVGSPAAISAAANKPAKVTECSADFSAGDQRLGPATLPNSGPAGLELKSYHRTGTLSTADFLAQYYDPTLYGGTGGWIYPPQNGYQLNSDGTPIEWHKTLPVGREIDRYGSEYGAFLSPAGMPFYQRAIPPSNLDSTPPAACNYHEYQVLKPINVDAGPIAAWFAQPGGGWQYQLDAALVPGAPASLNVLWLVDNGYLARMN